MKLGAKGYFGLFKTAALDWIDDKAPRLGAALAFYTIFSLAPLMTIVVTLASLWYTDNASHQVYSQMASVIGQDSAAGLEKMLVQQGEKKSGVFTAISAGLMLLIGATGVFVQLQDSLNEIWEVKPKPGQGIMGFIRHRMLSFGMILGVAFLLLSSLLLSTALSAVSEPSVPTTIERNTPRSYEAHDRDHRADEHADHDHRLHPDPEGGHELPGG